MSHIIDLTHTINSKMTLYPGSDSPVIDHINNVKEHSYAQTKLNLLSHHGTHIDAPSHMVGDGKSLDQFEVEKFFGKAVCIDCTKVKFNTIDKHHLEPFAPKIEQIDFVILHTNWSTKWGQNEYLKGFPALSAEACKWLIQFNLKGIGLDTISLDKIETKNYENHMIILGNNMIIIENLTNLNDVGPEIFTFSCFPIKYENADGSPVRAIAIL